MTLSVKINSLGDIIPFDITLCRVRLVFVCMTSVYLKK